MADPTPTRAEVEAQRRVVSFLRYQHAQICFERGDHKDEVDTPWSRGADAIEQCAALRERAEAAEAENQRTNQLWEHTSFMLGATLADLTAALRAKAAAWNDAIEAAAVACEPFDYDGVGDRMCKNTCKHRIRALRRAAPTEGEA